MKKVFSALSLFVVSCLLAQLACTLYFSLTPDPFANNTVHWQLLPINVADPLEVLANVITAVGIGLLMLLAVRMKRWMGATAGFFFSWTVGTLGLVFVACVGWSLSNSAAGYPNSGIGATMRDIRHQTGPIFVAYGVVALLATLFSMSVLSRLIGTSGTPAESGNSRAKSFAQLTDGRREIKVVSDGNIVDINSIRRAG